MMHGDKRTLIILTLIFDSNALFELPLSVPLLIVCPKYDSIVDTEIERIRSTILAVECHFVVYCNSVITFRCYSP